MREAELPILQALEAEPSLSQRELAQKVGLSVTKAHFLLRRMVEQGLVRVQNVAASQHKLGYLYLLTPRGMETKGRLAYAFLSRMAEQYQEMTTSVERVLATAIPRHATLVHRRVQVTVVGKGPLAEVVADRVSARDDALLVNDPAEADLAVVADPEAPFSARPGLQLVHLV